MQMARRKHCVFKSTNLSKFWPKIWVCVCDLLNVTEVWLIRKAAEDEERGKIPENSAN